MQWYFARDGKQEGPVDEAAFAKLVADGAITGATLVWHTGMPDWVPYGQVSGGPSLPGPVGTGPVACVMCKRSFPVSEMVQHQGASVCAECKPVFFQRIQEGGAIPGQMELASVGARFGARFVDGLILSGINFAMGYVVGSTVGAQSDGDNMAVVVGTQAAMSVVQILVAGVYTAFFLGKFGATPGKMAARIKVVRSDGSALTYGRGLGRFFGDMLSGLTFLIGYLMVFFDSERRCLHDRICDTRVIKVD